MGHRLVPAGRPQAQVLELVRDGAEPAQQRRHRLLADQQVLVAGLVATLAHGHRDAHRQPRADQVGQQRQLLRAERGDLVIAGHQRQHLALGHRQHRHRVGARDRQAARARRAAEVAEVDQPADLAVVADEHVVLVRVVVDRLRRERAQARQDLGGEALEHGRGVAGRIGEQVAGGEHVPPQAAGQCRVIEARQRAVDAPDGPPEAREHRRRVRLASRPRRARQPGEHAHEPLARLRPCAAVAGSDQPRDGVHAGEVLQRGVLQVEQLRVGRAGVELEHVATGCAVEREVEVDLAGQGGGAGLDAVTLARDPLGVGRRAHVTRPGVGSTASCSPRSTRPRNRSSASQTSTWRV